MVFAERRAVYGGSLSNHGVFGCIQTQNFCARAASTRAKKSNQSTSPPQSLWGGGKVLQLYDQTDEKTPAKKAIVNLHNEQIA
jgi:hypothetical protein